MNEIASHYTDVSDAWRIIMGQCQHFGLYQTESESIDQASSNLIEKLLSILDKKETIDENSSVLDIGCGLGGTAFFLHEKYGAAVTGIAISELEVDIANQTSSQKNLQQEVSFILADGLDSGLESALFSHVVMLESSLLFHDKPRLFGEVNRMLKPGGVLLICDQILKGKPSPKQMYQYGKDFEILENCFGKTRTETLEQYKTHLQETAFTEIYTEDISELVKTSPSHWKENALNKKTQVLEYFSENRFENFTKACDALELMMRENILGYAVIKAVKPRR